MAEYQLPVAALQTGGSPIGLRLALLLSKIRKRHDSLRSGRDGGRRESFLAVSLKARLQKSLIVPLHPGLVADCAATGYSYALSGSIL